MADTLFKQLTNLFRSGPTLRRKVKSVDSRVAIEKEQGGGARVVGHTNFPGHSSYVVGFPGVAPHERLSRLQDFVEMDSMAEINAALDIYADETVAQDVHGRSFHIYSNNPKIKKQLEDLFYNRINLEFNLRPWVRNMPVRKDTVIPLLDGRNITIEQLAQEYKEGKENWVYSVQDGTARTVPGKVQWCDLTRTASKLVRIWLDNETYVDCTPDHEWILRDGSKKRADELEPGQSMMPFYRKISDKSDSVSGYEKVYDPASNRYVFTHRRIAENLSIAAEDYCGDKVVTHHIDFNKLNNSPSNLRRMDHKKHFALHGEVAAKNFHTPENTAKRMAGIDKWLRSDKHREYAKEQLKVLQAAGLMKTSWDEYNNSPLYQEHMPKRLEALRKSWDENKDKVVESMKIKFDQECLEFISNIIVEDRYVTLQEVCNSLSNNEAFMSHFKFINKESIRDVRKTLTTTGISNCIRKHGYASFAHYYKEKFPSIVSNTTFQKAYKYNLSRTGKKNKPKNHKVLRIEHLNIVDDVYCMEVVNPFGGNKDDRHNFMILSKDINGNLTNSGICSSNCKYGDGFYFVTVEEGQGVTSLVPMPVHDVLREEGYNGDPSAVRFRWNSMGNKIVENWECAHMRLLGSDTYLPYGASMLDGARKVWRQLVMLEDAMLVYRLSRSPERRVFYIDVGNIPTDEVPNYMEQAKSNLVSAGVSDKTNGRLDQRFAPLSILEDFYIPTRGADTGTRIDTLQAGANTGNIEDVEYLRKKLVGSLKVPRAYLGYEEGLGSRSSLAAEDIRFSRTVNMIQRTVISELNKVAMVHLFACGFREDDLINFSLHLSNPSTIAQQQKLELYRTRFEIAGTTPENFLSKKFVYRNILNMTEEEILNVKREILEEARESEAVEAAGMGAGGGGDEAEAGDEVTPDEAPADDAGGEEVETAGKFPREGDLLDEDDDDEDGEERMFAPPDLRNQKSVKLAPGMKKYLKNRRRTLARRGDPFSYRETDKRNGLDDPFDKGSLNEQLQFEEFSEENMIIASPPQEKIPTITMQPACGINDLKELQKMEERFRIKRGVDSAAANNLLTEAADIHPDDENIELESLDDADLYANLTVQSDDE